MKINFIFALGFIIFSTTFAQYNSHDPNGEIDAILEPLIKARFDERYSYGYQVIDSMIGGFSDFEEEEIQDPYGTLRGCTIFGVSRGNDGMVISDSSYFGILKDGNIIWLSPPIFKGEWTSVYATKDINNDGKVEILTTWCNEVYSTEYMWIISWDGVSGSVINALNDGSDDTTETGNSVLLSSAHMYELFDVDNDNVYEIRAYWASDENDRETWYFPETQIVTRPWVTYKWNGVVYDIAPSSEQIPASFYLPANKLIVEVACRVNQKDSLEYIYKWKNLSESKQRMNLFALNNISYFSTSQIFSGWWYIGQKRGMLTAYLWKPQGRGYKYTLGAGQQAKGLTLNSIGLPGIIQFYIQGYRPTPDYNRSDPNLTQHTVDDLLENSYSGHTLGPVNAPVPFVQTIFTDTLSNYVTQSRTLGWIDNDGISKSLTQKLESAKQQLQKGNTTPAKNAIQAFIKEVEAQKEKHLTSEAYALLKYNAEYLLETLGGK